MPESLEELTNVPFPWEISAGDFEKLGNSIHRERSHGERLGDEQDSFSKAL